VNNLDASRSAFHARTPFVEAFRLKPVFLDRSGNCTPGHVSIESRSECGDTALHQPTSEILSPHPSNVVYRRSRVTEWKALNMLLAAFGYGRRERDGGQRIMTALKKDQGKVKSYCCVRRRIAR